MHSLNAMAPEASVIVTALVNGLWQGMVLVGLGWCLLRVLSAKQRLNATTRYAVWMVTLVAVVGLSMLAGFSASRALLTPQPVAGSPPAAAIGQPGPPLEGVVRSGPALWEPSAEEAASTDVGERSEPAVEMQESVPVAPSDPARGWHLEVPVSFGGWIPFLVGAWLLTALLLLLRVAWGYRALQRLKGQSRPLPLYRQRLQGWLKSERMPRTVAVAATEALATPVAAGLWRPMILIPASLVDQLTEEELEQVLLHELAHLQRGDDWTNLVQRLAEAILFFHPAVYWIGQALDREREMACDDWVVARTQRPRSYATCLARLVELNIRLRSLRVAPGMAVSKERLFERVRRVLDRQRRVTTRLARSGFLTILLTMVAVFLIMTRLAPWITFSAHRLAVEEATAQEPVPIRAEAAFVLQEPAVREPFSLVQEPAVAAAFEPVRASFSEPVIPAQSASAALSAARVDSLRAPGVSYRVPAVYVGSEAQAQRVAPPLRDVSNPDLSVASWIRVLQSAARISASGTRARLLMEAAERMPDNEAVYAAYISAAGTIPSPGDQQRALSALLEHHRLGASTLRGFLEVVGEVQANGEKARLLIAVAGQLPDDEALHAAYLAVAETLSASGDYRRVISALLETQNRMR